MSISGIMLRHENEYRLSGKVYSMLLEDACQRSGDPVSKRRLLSICAFVRFLEYLVNDGVKQVIHLGSQSKSDLRHDLTL